jgi:hypothetical protein
VDIVNIAAALWRDPTLRQNMVDQAQKYPLTATSDGKPISNPDQAAAAIRDLNTKLSQDLRLPIGWQTETYVLQGKETCTLLPQGPSDLFGILYGADCMQIESAVPNMGLFGKLLGLIITAVAVSQGAPFWFDLLSKLVNLRGSGAVPATSQEEEQKNNET